MTTDHGLGGGGWFGLLPAMFDRFLTVSRFSAAVLGVPAHRTRVVYGGADEQRFAPDPDRSRDGVLFVGRLTPHKGIDRLIRALPDGARLTVAGTGGHDARLPERDYPLLLRRLARDRDVVFPGAVPDADLPELHRGAAVFVLPTVKEDCYGRHVAISELLGLSVLEAMASGTPVIASRLDGLPEVVRDGETGFLVTPGDVDELRDRVAQLLADRALAARMGAPRPRPGAREVHLGSVRAAVPVRVRGAARAVCSQGRGVAAEGGPVTPRRGRPASAPGSGPSAAASWSCSHRANTSTVTASASTTVSRSAPSTCAAASCSASSSRSRSTTMPRSSRSSRRTTTSSR